MYAVILIKDGDDFERLGWYWDFAKRIQAKTTPAEPQAEIEGYMVVNYIETEETAKAKASSWASKHKCHAIVLNMSREWVAARITPQGGFYNYLDRYKEERFRGDAAKISNGRDFTLYADRDGHTILEVHQGGKKIQQTAFSLKQQSAIDDFIDLADELADKKLEKVLFRGASSGSEVEPNCTEWHLSKNEKGSIVITHGIHTNGMDLEG